MSSILNGVRWTEKRLTDEQLLLLEDAEKRKLGCLKCEGISDISDGDFNLSIEKDMLRVIFDINFEDFRHYDSLDIQVSYCPFCGKKL